MGRSAPRLPPQVVRAWEAQLWQKSLAPRSQGNHIKLAYPFNQILAVSRNFKGTPAPDVPSFCDSLMTQGVQAGLRVPDVIMRSTLA